MKAVLTDVELSLTKAVLTDGGFSAQVEAAAAGVAEAPGVHACVVQREHADICGPHHPGNEQRAALHEGPRQPHPR